MLKTAFSGGKSVQKVWGFPLLSFFFLPLPTIPLPMETTV